jgi:hypothetical protein
MQHAKEILGKYNFPTNSQGITRPPNVPSHLNAAQANPLTNLQQCSFYTFASDDMISTTNNNMPINHKPTADNISTTKNPPLKNSFCQP